MGRAERVLLPYVMSVSPMVSSAAGACSNESPPSDDTKNPPAAGTPSESKASPAVTRRVSVGSVCRSMAKRTLSCKAGTSGSRKVAPPSVVSVRLGPAHSESPCAPRTCTKLLPGPGTSVNPAAGVWAVAEAGMSSAAHPHKTARAGPNTEETKCVFMRRWWYRAQCETGQGRRCFAGCRWRWRTRARCTDRSRQAGRCVR